jgi:FkbM family methyltransferase
MKAYRDFRTAQMSARDVVTEYGFRFAGNPDYLSPDWEINERRVIQCFLDAADLFIDVGANQGFYSCVASSRGKPVVAVEPEAGNLRFLMRNALVNSYDRMEIYPIAISDRVGVLTLHGDGDTASLVGGWGQTPSYFTQLVPTNLLDNLLAGRWSGRQLLIKMDVEGAEAFVLDGAPEIINRSPKPIWIIETFPDVYGIKDARNSGFQKVFRTMFGAGYKSFAVADQITPVTMDTVTQWTMNDGSRSGPPSNFIFMNVDSDLPPSLTIARPSSP